MIRAGTLLFVDIDISLDRLLPVLIHAFFPVGRVGVSVEVVKSGQGDGFTCRNALG